MGEGLRFFALKWEHELAGGLTLGLRGFRSRMQMSGRTLYMTINRKALMYGAGWCGWGAQRSTHANRQRLVRRP